MAGKTLETYATFTALDNHWAIWDQSILTDLCDWIVVAMVKYRTGYIGGSVSATKDLGNLYIVGKKALIEPSPGIFTASSTGIDQQVSGEIPDSAAPWYNRVASDKHERNNYYYWESGIGSPAFGSLSVDYVYDTVEDFEAALDNNDITEVFDSTLQYHVYINGSKDPTITSIPLYAEGSGLSTLLIKPMLWTAVEDSASADDNPFIFDSNKHIYVPNENVWFVSPPNTLELTENHVDQYLSVSENLGARFNSIAKVMHYGIDGVANHVKLLLQFYYEDSPESYGDAYIVWIPRNVSSLADITVQRVDQTAYNDPQFNTRVVLHLGAPPSIFDPDSDSFPGGRNSDDDDDGVYTDPEGNPDFDPYEGDGFDGDCVLTKTYKVDKSTLQNIGTKMWTQSYFNVLKVQNNPIENIVSVKEFPFEPTGGSLENIKVGDVDFQIRGDKIHSCEKIDIGTYTYSGYHGNFLDFSPYTVIKAYLPYCGWIQLDASSIYNRQLKFSYVVDYVTGECMCMITADKMPFMEVKGNMGVEIPLTSSNAVQTQIKEASAVVNTAASTAGHIMGQDYLGAATAATSGALNIAGMDFQTQRSGSQSPLCATYSNHAVAVFVEHPLTSGATPSEGYKHLHGYPCHKYVALKSLYGFVQVDRRADISNISMTDEERKMLEDIMVSGAYIWTSAEKDRWNSMYG